MLTRTFLIMAAAGALSVAPAYSLAQTNAAAAAPPAAVETGYADVDGLRIHYQVHGDLTSTQTPLLVLHGSYMSGDAMMPIIERFAATRPVIAIDQRGHGRTDDAEGPITYEKLADDAAGVLEALEIPTADVLGYSMGANTAVLMAIRHPERVGKLIPVAGTYRRDGWYPEVLQAMAQMTPEFFAGTPMEAEYKRLAPDPDAFPILVEKLKALDAAPQAWPEDQIRAIRSKTMIVVGDADGVRLEHAVELFKLRGGGDEEAAARGFMTEPPQARLAILPGTSHIGIMANAELIAALVTPFLDDVTPPMPEGFF
jgi:pimeloyl-ACP methyl ester carboxylesterase